MWSQCWSAELVVPSWLLLLLVVVSRVALPHKVDEAAEVSSQGPALQGLSWGRLVPHPHGHRSEGSTI